MHRRLLASRVIHLIIQVESNKVYFRQVSVDLVSEAVICADKAINSLEIFISFFSFARGKK